MKKAFALILSLLTMFSFLACVHASALEVVHSALFILYPKRDGNKMYESVEYEVGAQIVEPSRASEAVFEDDTYYYQFVGWDRFEGATPTERAVKVNEYYDNKPGPWYVAYDEPYTVKPLPVMGDLDIVLHAEFRLMPKIYDIGKDRSFDIRDVSQLLNILGTEQDPDLVYDITEDGFVNINDVSELLNFLGRVITD